eukprot:GEMP01043335.1.p1 GENE.GEMP01043335.1~~GEMP01043335.1.p1  ORF type:complete len:307 (+),score=65.23 GEMP01043335.1:5-925(+)
MVVVEHNLGYVIQHLDFAPGPDLVVAASSYIEDDKNHVDILEVSKANTKDVTVKSRIGIDMPFPATSCGWLTPTTLVCTGEDVRLFDVSEKPKVLRTWVHENENVNDACTPITSSFCDQANKRVISTDIYGCCAIWDVESPTALVALNLQQPLHSVAQNPQDPHMFVLAADSGDVFMFDQREHQKVHALTSIELEDVKGPARMAWGAHLAVNWLMHKGVYIYDIKGGKPRNATPLLKTTTEYICWDDKRLICARSDGICDVVTDGDTYSWTPREKVSPCTSVAVSQSSFCAIACDGVAYLAPLPKE